MNQFGFAAVAIFCSAAAFAQGTAPDALAGLRTCMAEKDQARRLSCYDAEMARMTPQVRAESVPSPVPPPVSATAEESFGYRGKVARQELDRQEVAAEPRIEQLTASVTEMATQPYGEFVITLDNGQVWAQKRPDTSARLKVGDQVTIKPGSFGSFSLVTPRGRSTQVARVR